MMRTHTCGELRATHAGLNVTLCGWIQRIRDKGSLLWIDLRDRYGVTQLIFSTAYTPKKLLAKARTLGREYVLHIQGEVIIRNAKNSHLPTGEVEIQVTALEVLNAAKLPPFLIEEETDGGEELRMQYRYLDLRRPSLQKNLLLRHQLMQQMRSYLNERRFLELETPMLIKSTPEGARDFIVPSRLQPTHCYALPQSPQILKQLLMIGGFDRYYQLARCFRDEDLRADRQPEFTQLDCELSFVTQDDILAIFEGMIRDVMLQHRGITLPTFPRITYTEAMRLYGSDKPDLRFGMPLGELTHLTQKRGFRVFDEAALVAGICAPGCASYTRKQLDSLTSFVKQPQVGAQGLVYVKCQEDGSFSSSVDKFFSPIQLKQWADLLQAQPGDLILILAGAPTPTRQALSALRLKMGDDLGLRSPDQWRPLWVVDFPILSWDEAMQRYHALHHPFTAPHPDDITLLQEAPTQVRAQAYDLVINGVEIGGGSMRIHNRTLQEKILGLLGFSPEEAMHAFGFLLEALSYGAPPHGGIALGVDRLCAVLGGEESIRPFIAFPKNNAGRDMMLHTPAPMVTTQLQELGIQTAEPKRGSYHKI